MSEIKNVNAGRTRGLNMDAPFIVTLKTRVSDRHTHEIPPHSGLTFFFPGQPPPAGELRQP
jgi:hypothetical protein